MEPFYAFLLVFVRCSALLLSSPVFGAQNTPVNVRILTTLAICGAIATAIPHPVTKIPSEPIGLLLQLGHEAIAGLLIGAFVTLALQVAEIAGAIMDLQVGLAMSQVMNPISGIGSTVLAQYKQLLSIVVFLCADGHHMLIRAMISSYSALPFDNPALIEHSYVRLLGSVLMIALQITTPVIATSLLVDAALGLLNRAVPQMQAVQVGIPAKIAMGLGAVAAALPAVVAGTVAATEAAFQALAPIIRM